MPAVREREGSLMLNEEQEAARVAAMGDSPDSPTASTVTPSACDGSWAGAIREAKLQLRIARARVERLERALEIFRERKKSDDPFPCGAGIAAHRAAEEL